MGNASAASETAIHQSFHQRVSRWKWTWRIILLLSASALIIDWKELTLRFVRQPDEPAARRSVLVPPNTEFLMKQYERAVEEIQSRLSQQSVLFGFKFTLVGAILAILFTDLLKRKLGREDESQLDASGDAGFTRIAATPTAAAFLWSAVVVSGIVDGRIFFHSDLIVELGKWIRLNVEPVLYGGSDVQGWEESFAASDLVNSPWFPLLRMNSGLLTLAMFLGAVALFSDDTATRTSLASRTRGVSLLGSCAALVIFAKVAMHVHRNAAFGILYCLFFLLLGLFASWVLWGPLDTAQPTAPSPQESS